MWICVGSKYPWTFCVKYVTCAPLPREGSGDEHVIKTRNVNRRHFAFGADYSSRETPICD